MGLLSTLDAIARKEKQAEAAHNATLRVPLADRAQLEDYRDSGFDRGHMAPAADMPTARAMAQSFSLANMVPQAPSNNRQIWANVERDTRAYVKRSGSTVYVFTGPAWDGRPTTAIGGRVAVPTHLYKLVYTLPGTGRGRTGWRIPTTPGSADRSPTTR